MALVAVVGSLADVAPAAANQHGNGYYYANWDFGSSSPATEIEQVMHIGKTAPATYWAQVWDWAGQDQGGYMGLQKDGIRHDGSVGDMALFSIWNADAAKGKSCATFGGEGTGYSCSLAYPVRTADDYKFHVDRGTSDATGWWWTASVTDLTTGVDTILGRIHAPSAKDSSVDYVTNFTEYFGDQVPCNAVPESSVTWAEPGWRAKASDQFTYADYYAADGDKGACTNGSATKTTLGGQPAIGIVMGGPLHATTTRLAVHKSGVVSKALRLKAAVHSIDHTAPAGSIQFSVDGRTLGKPVRLPVAAAGIFYTPTRRGHHSVTASFRPARGAKDSPSSSTSKLVVR